MTTAEVQSLLDNFDYKTALQAYLPHCTNVSLKKLLQSSADSPNSFTIKKLRQGLRELMDEIPQDSPPHASSSDIPPFKKGGAAGEGFPTHDNDSLKSDYHSAPLEVQQKISERIMLVSEARLLRSRLRRMNALERREAVLTIAENWQKAQLCYEYEEYWKSNGELPPEPVKPDELVLPDSVEDLIKRRNTLRTYRKRSSWSKHEPEFNLIVQNLKEKGVE